MGVSNDDDPGADEFTFALRNFNVGVVLLVLQKL